MLKIYSDVKLIKALLCIIFFLFFINTLNATEPSESFKKAMAIRFYIQTSGKNEKFTIDLNGNVAQKKNTSYSSITINNCYLTDFHKYSENTKKFEKTFGKDNVLLRVSSVYKAFKIDHIREITEQTAKNWLIANKAPNKPTKFKCKKDKSGLSNVNLNTAWNSAQILAVPKYLETTLQKVSKGRSTSFPDDFTRIGEIQYSELVNKSNSISSNKQKINDEKNQLNLSYSNSKNKSSIGGLILNLPSYNKTGTNYLRTCTASYKDIDAERVFGYRLYGKSILLNDIKTLFDENKLGWYSEGSKFDMTFKDVNEAYLSFIDGKAQCSFYVDYAENISKLKKGLDKKKINSSLTKIISNKATENKYAVSKGYESANERNFIIDIGGNSYLAKKLRVLEIDNIDKFNLLLAEIKQSGYEDNPTVNTISIYLSDKKNALRNGIGINEYRKQRITSEKRAAEKTRKETLERERKYANEYPYEAIIKCGVRGSHSSLVNCFTGGGKYGVNTSLEIKNGSSYKMYKNIEMMGNANLQDTSKGVFIPLKKNFNITAQNASDVLTLTVTVRDYLTKKTLFEKSAAKFGAIKIKN